MKSNSLTSHHGESRNSRADKMSGSSKNKAHKLNSSKNIFKLGVFGKHFYNRKRRMFLKNPLNYDKI